MSDNTVRDILTAVKTRSHFTIPFLRSCVPTCNRDEQRIVEFFTRGSGIKMQVSIYLFLLCENSDFPDLIEDYTKSQYKSNEHKLLFQGNQV